MREDFSQFYSYFKVDKYFIVYDKDIRPPRCVKRNIVNHLGEWILNLMRNYIKKILSLRVVTRHI